MRFLAATLLFFILSQPASGQWTAKNIGTDDNLFCLTNSGQEWLAGSFGSVFFSSNDGSSWAKRELKDPNFGIPIAQNVRCARLTAPQTGQVSGLFFTGNDQAVVSSTDGFQTISVYPITGGIGWPKQISDWFFKQNNTGFACGSNHSLLRTTNNGQSWTAVGGTQNELFGIDFFDEQNGLAVGAFTTMRTTNGGSSWQTLGTLEVMLDVSMASAQVAYAVSERQLFRTTDAGTTWEPLGVPFFDLRCVRALNEQEVLVGTGGGIFIVREAGQAFSFFDETQILAASGQYAGVNNFFKKGNDIRAACDAGYLLHASDWSKARPLALATFEKSGGGCDTLKLSGAGFAGANWASEWWLGDQKLSNSTHFQTVFTQTVADTLFFVVKNSLGSDTIFWPVGQEVFVDIPRILPPQINLCSGNLLRFNPPAGSFFSWEPAHLFQNPANHDALFIGENSATIYGHFNFNGCYGTDTVRIEILDDFSREHWKPTLPTPHNFTFLLDFVDETHGFAIERGGDKFIRTTDGTATWSAPYQFFNPTASSFSMDFLDTTLGYVAYAEGLFKTTDAGANWTQINTDRSLQNLHFFDEKNGIATGAGITPFTYHVLKTTDGGQSWTSTFSGAGIIKSIQCRTPIDCYCVGYNFAQSQILHSSDGGASWQPSGFDEPIPFQTFSIVGKDSLFAADWSVNLYFSKDGGKTWSLFNRVLPFTVSQVVFSFKMFDHREGYLSYDAKLLKTFDGGYCWYKLSDIEKGGTSDAFDYAFPSANHRYYSGPLGDAQAKCQILRLDSVSLVGLEEVFFEKENTQPLLISPNPALAGGQFSVDASGFLQVFDLHGRLVFETFLKNEGQVLTPLLPPGFYIVAVREGEKTRVGKLVVSP